MNREHLIKMETFHKQDEKTKSYFIERCEMDLGIKSN